jgi:hypothetical protein
VIVELAPLFQGPAREIEIRPCGKLDTAAVTRPQTPQIQRELAVLGALQSVSFRGVGLQGWDIYEAKFANGISICRIFLAAGGKVSGLLFQWGP